MVVDIVELDPIWKALSDSTRRAVLDLLRERPRTTGELTAEFAPRLSRFAVIKHIAVLESAGLVVSRRRGRHVWHYLNAVPLQEIYERWVKPYEALWASSLIHLKHHAEAASQIKEVRMEVMETIHIEQQLRIEAEPARVFRALTEDVDAWWTHRFAPDSSTVSLEPVVGGHFRETFTHGGGALYGVVSYVDPGRRLSLRGPMGMRGAVSGVITFDLEGAGTGTMVRLSHRVVGDVDTEERDQYSAGWAELLNLGLKLFVEGQHVGV